MSKRSLAFVVLAVLAVIVAIAAFEQDDRQSPDTERTLSESRDVSAESPEVTSDLRADERLVLRSTVERIEREQAGDDAGAPEGARGEPGSLLVGEPIAQEEPLSTRSEVLALPGIEGFEAAPSPRWESVALALAEEDEDSAWSTRMEADILSEISQVAGLEVLTLYVECRATMCGVLFVYPDEAGAAEKYVEVREALAAELGFGGQMSFGRPGENGIRFTSIYLQGGKSVSEARSVTAGSDTV